MTSCLVPAPIKACPSISNNDKQVMLPADQLPGEAGSLWHLFKASLDSLQFAELHVSLTISSLSTLQTSGRTSGPAACSGSRMTLQLWAVSVKGGRPSARTWPTPPSVWDEPPAANTDRTKESVVDFCRWRCEHANMPS